MQITCKDRERIFLDGGAEEWAGLELHAASCAECAEEVRAWKALSAAAAELRDYRARHCGPGLKRLLRSKRRYR